MLMHVLALVIATLPQAAQAQTNPAPQPSDDSEMSIVERAAAARKATAEKASQQNHRSPDGPPPLTPEQRGLLRSDAYVNDFLHFQIALSQWQPLSDERVALSQSMARKYVNPDSRPSPYRVLWAGDTTGRTVILSIAPLPPDAPRDLDQLVAGMKRVATVQLARAEGVQEYREQILLGDPAHKFGAFRVAASIRDTQIVQSEQMMIQGGFLLSFVITGHSDQDVSEALRSLNASIAWTATTP